MGCCASSEAPPPEANDAKARSLGDDNDGAAAADGGQAAASTKADSSAAAAPGPQKQDFAKSSSAAKYAAADATPERADKARSRSGSGKKPPRGAAADGDSSPLSPASPAGSRGLSERFEKALEAWRDGENGATAPTTLSWKRLIAPPPPAEQAWPQHGFFPDTSGITTAGAALSTSASGRHRSGTPRRAGRISATPPGSFAASPSAAGAVPVPGDEAYNVKAVLEDAQRRNTGRESEPFDLLEYGRRYRAEQDAAAERRAQRDSARSSLHSSPVVSRPQSAHGSRSSPRFPGSRPGSAQGPRPSSAKTAGSGGGGFDSPTEGDLLGELDGMVNDGDDELDAAIGSDATTASPNMSLHDSVTSLPHRLLSGTLGKHSSSYALLLSSMHHSSSGVGGARAPIAPAIPVMREADREYDSDEEPLPGDVDFDSLFAARADSAQSRRRIGTADGSRSESNAAATREATPGFVAVEEDCRRALSASVVKRQFLESAPKWTPTRSRDGSRAGRRGRAGRKGDGGSGGLDGLPPRPRRKGDPAFDDTTSSDGDSATGGNRYVAGVGDESEFVSEQRQLLAVAAPEFVLTMEEAAAREEIRATWAARLFGAHAGVESSVLFLRHRRELEWALASHATLLRFCYDRLTSLKKLAIEHAQALELGELLRGPVPRKLLLRQAFERDREARAAREAERAAIAAEEKHLSQRRRAREWAAEKAALDNRAADSELAALRKAADEADRRRADGVKPERAALERLLGNVGSGKSKNDADPASTMSRAKRRLLEHVESIANDECRGRHALQLEHARRIDAIVAAAARVIPITGDAADIIAARKAAEVAAAKLDVNRARRRAEQRSLNPKALQLHVADARGLSEALRARLRVLEAEHDASRDDLAAEEAGERTAVAGAEAQARAVVETHDARADAIRQREWFVREARLRKENATALLQRAAYGAVVRRRLRLVLACPDEVRALVSEESRQFKMIRHGQLLSYHDTLQFFVLTAPEPALMARHAPDCVATPDCVPSVEALGRRRIVLEREAALQEFAAAHAAAANDCATLPPHLVGQRQRCALKLQAWVRGVRLRRRMADGWRDRLVFERMRRVKARMEGRALVEIETLHRSRCAEAESEAWVALMAAAVAGVEEADRRLAATVLLQATGRAYALRRFTLPGVREAYWLDRYHSTQRGKGTKK